MHTLKDTNVNLTLDIEAARARILTLEDMLARATGADGRSANGVDPTQHPPPPPVPTVANLVGPASQSFTGEFARVAISALSMKEHAALGMEGRRGHSRTHSMSPGPEPVTELLTHEGALKVANMYFDFNALSYPILDRKETLAVINEMYGIAPTAEEKEREREREPPRRRTTGSSTNSDMSDDGERRQFLAGMVLAIGAHAAARAGPAGNGQEAAIAQMVYRSTLKYRERALEREDVTCVQAICLMALWTMSNPASGSIWQLVGLAARVITAIGLHRRADPGVPPHIAEQRRRLFWAFYNIDRILAPTLCKPLAICEEDIDIELPTQGPDDPFFRGNPIIGLTRHVVRYRGLMGRILTQLYSVNGRNNGLPEPDRIAIVHSLHSELDQWIVDCPTSDDRGPDAPKANYSAWWQIHYNHGLCTLYRPSPLYPETTPETLRALYDASSRCVDLYLDMYNVNKTSFHLLQIIALFVSCISLLCCLCECDARMRAAETDASAETVAVLAELGLGRYTGADDPTWAAEIRSRVSQCQSLFDAFGHHLPASARYRDTFFRISELLLARYGPLDKAEESGASVASGHAGQAVETEAATLKAEPELGQPGGSTQPPQPQPQPQTQTQSQPQQHDDPAPPYAAPAPVMDVTQTGLVPQVAPGEKAPAIPGVDDMAGAWDAMTQLWFDLGDMFGDESDPFATLDSWAGEWQEVDGGVGGVGVGVGGVGGSGVGVGGPEPEEVGVGIGGAGGAMAGAGGGEMGLENGIGDGQMGMWNGNRLV